MNYLCSALAAMWWEHGALRALVQWVSGLTWSKDSEVFELACRSTEALLGNERVGSPVAETFIEAVLVVIKEKGTECLAIYKQLLAVLDIPAVKQVRWYGYWGCKTDLPHESGNMDSSN